MNNAMIVRALLAAVMAAVAVSARASVFSLGGSNTSLTFVTVGDPGNVADPATGSLYGAVPYTYQMGAYDVTLGQYTAFLNAVAKTDTYGCYNSNMAAGQATFPFGISQSGSSGNYSYSVTGSNPQAANMPVSCETWMDAARFCNWLQNGQPSGSEGMATTENGAYTLNGDTTSGTESRNAGATYFLPSENEWYKAAYYKSGGTNAGYWTYPTQSNTAPGNSLALALSTSNEANCNNPNYTDPTNYLTPAGTFAASPGPYGTYDMGGDLFQWNEAIFGSSRGIRGGNWYSESTLLASSDRGGAPPTLEINVVGFRVASAVPEPGSLALALSCAVVFGIWRLRRNA